MEKKTKKLIFVIFSSMLVAIATSIVFGLTFVLVAVFKYKVTLFSISVVFLILILIPTIYYPFEPVSDWDAFLIIIYTIMSVFFGVIIVVCVLAFTWYLITVPEYNVEILINVVALVLSIFTAPLWYLIFKEKLDSPEKKVGAVLGYLFASVSLHKILIETVVWPIRYFYPEIGL
jgi:hypothetical protein